LASRWTHARTGWKAIATTAVAAIDRARLGRTPCCASDPRPTTIATYTPVMNTASDP
jgi:hypothetical protein